MINWDKLIKDLVEVPVPDDLVVNLLHLIFWAIVVGVLLFLLTFCGGK